MTFEVAIFSTRKKDHDVEKKKRDLKPAKQFFLGRNPFIALTAATAERELLGESEKEVLDYLNNMIYEAELNDESETITQQDLMRFRAEQLSYEDTDKTSRGSYEKVKIPFKRPADSPAHRQASTRSIEKLEKAMSKPSGKATKLTALDEVVRRQERAMKAESDSTLTRQAKKKGKKNTNDLRGCPTIRGFDGFMMY